MESKAKVLGHPAHPILIVFPLGLLATSVIFSLIYLFTDNDTMSVVSYWMTVAGILGGLVAAVPGVVDWIAIPSGTRAKRVGAIHGLGNVVVLVLFVLSWLLRRDEPSYVPSTLALIISLLAFVIAGVTGWLGGELVDRLGVGVDRHANLNAPNALTVRHVPESEVSPSGPHSHSL
ncbi:DUF2231 domain-containing protein [Larkinella insperata]|uniref:DUF2231 domain-containing protein n=1 Tax=Larkinella insperata TaxID=332158 RepID=A0ABW3Q7F6_9BACT|nr:DUF2231 domain-containing protein [Larkinella insperata]